MQLSRARKALFVLQAGAGFAPKQVLHVASALHAAFSPQQLVSMQVPHTSAPKSSPHAAPHSESLHGVPQV
jgi:hypothetical protein